MPSRSAESVQPTGSATDDVESQPPGTTCSLTGPFAYTASFAFATDSKYSTTTGTATPAVSVTDRPASYTTVSGPPRFPTHPSRTNVPATLTRTPSSPLEPNWYTPDVPTVRKPL